MKDEVKDYEKTHYSRVSYTLQGDYYLPDLTLPAGEDKPIGIWEQRHLRYLKQHRKAPHNSLFISGKLNIYLSNQNEEAEKMFLRLVKELAEKDGITEQLKAENQMVWVQCMNAVREASTDIVNNDLIYA